MYLNLKAEMIRQQVTVDDIAKKLNLSPDTVGRKVNGHIGFSIAQCKEVSTLFKFNNSIEYLFEKKQKRGG